VVGLDDVAAFMSGLHRIGYLSPALRPRVYCEVMQLAPMSSLGVVAHCQDALLEAWDRAVLADA